MCLPSKSPPFLLPGTFYLAFQISTTLRKLVILRKCLQDTPPASTRHLTSFTPLKTPCLLPGGRGGAPADKEVLLPPEEQPGFRSLTYAVILQPPKASEARAGQKRACAPTMGAGAGGPCLPFLEPGGLGLHAVIPKDGDGSYGDVMAAGAPTQLGVQSRA